MLPCFHTLYFETTRKCNFACDNCSSGSHLKDANWGDELTTDEIISRVLLPAYKLGTRYIAFSGGEFLLRKDAISLLKAANDLGFRISVVSNGSTLHDKTIYKLKDLLGDNLLVSLGINSFNNEENTTSRSVATNKVVTLIDKLEAEHININICVTIGKHTAGSLHDTLAKIRELKLPSNRIPFAPRHSDAKNLMFDKETMQNKIHPELRKYHQGYVSFVPFFISPELYEKYSGQNEKTHKVPTNPSVGCWCGSFYSVNPEGEVTPCPLLGDHFSGGNVKTEELEDILYKSELFQKIVSRNDFGGKCGKCRFRFTCGGCRTMTYYHTGDLFGEDPTCFIDNLSDDELKEIEMEMAKNFKNYIRLCNFGGLYSNDEKI
jgi:AdoMet-dependent heme synthase